MCSDALSDAQRHGGAAGRACERLTRVMAESSDWSDCHQADEQFHQLVGTASGLGTAVEAYHETLAELYAYFIPYPIELLHKSNRDHVALGRVTKAGF